MNEPRANSFPEIAPPQRGWPVRKVILLVVVALLLHVALIFIFGTKKPAARRAVKNVPQLQLANDASELVALQNPALFALPNPRDFASVIWSRTPSIRRPDFRWAAPTGDLPLAAEKLGTTFRLFMETYPPVAMPLSPRIELQPLAPVVTAELALPKNSSLQISGALAQRKILRQPALPSLPLNEVIPPSKVQALVDAAGNVVSVVLLEPSGDAGADEKALVMARAVRFVPAEKMALGDLIFHWHTVPVPASAP